MLDTTFGITSNYIEVYPDIHAHREVAQEVDSYVTSQFREQSAKYVAAYQSVGHWTYLLGLACQAAGITDYDRDYSILDIGSGAGNTVFAALDTFKNGRVLATDISLEMLVHLKSFLNEQEVFADRCRMAQLNCEKPELQPGAFDIVIGGSILHHLRNPEKTIFASQALLKPGGLFIAFEPFEAGYAVLSGIYKILLRDLPLDSHAARVLKAMIQDWTVRKGSDKSDPIFFHLDDKWLFTHSWFKQFVPPYASCKIESTFLSKRPFTDETREILRVNECPAEGIPDDGWAMLEDFDHSMSEDLRRDFLFTGVVILQS